MNHKKLIAYLILSLNSVTLIAQSSNYANGILPKVIQPLPDAAALGKFGNVPVGLFTGVPQISVPLYTIDLKEFSLPISIDYHASGVRVDEISSTVGLGWALNAGGMISCTVNDIYDFDSSGLFNSGDAIYSRYKDGTFRSVMAEGGTAGNSDYMMIKQMADGGLDGEPDEFNFSFAGKSGKFVFDETQTARTIPYEPLKIEFSQLNNSFVLTDIKGVKYLFAEEERSSVNPVTGSTCSNVNWFYSIVNMTPTWYLSTITTPNGDVISFNYSTVSYSYSLTDSETLYYQNGLSNSCSRMTPPVDQRCKNEVNVQEGKRLTSISTTKGHLVKFTYRSSARLDLPGTNSLESIAVKYDGQPITAWALNHDYFISSTSASNPENYRLKLTAIKQETMPPYSFVYDSTVLPERNSARQDFWGYYNGAQNGNSLVPEVRLELGEMLPGAKREVNPLMIQAGILKRIIYPTSGSTEFVYEPNDYLFTGQERTFESFSTGVLTLAAQGTQSTTFTTGANVSQGDFVFQTNIPSSSSVPPGDHVTAQLSGPSWNEYFETTSHSKVVALAPNTTYTLTLHSTTDGYNNNGGFTPLNASLSVTWSGFSQQSVVKNVAGGGVRVVQSIDDTNDGALPVIKGYVYKDESTPANSSGYVINDPIHSFRQDFYEMDPASTHNMLGPCSYIVRTSQSNASLSAIKSNSVGYEYVTVLNGINGEGGKTITKYMKYADVGDHHEYVRGSVSGAYPNVYMKNTSYDFLRGLVLDESVYKRSESSYIKVEQSVYSYRLTDDLTKFIPGITSGENNKNILGLKSYMVKPELIGLSEESIRGVFELLPHYFISNWYNLSEHQRTIYSVNGTPQVTNTTLYYYDNPAHSQLSRTVNITSQGVEQTLATLYPNDYASGTSFIDDMKNSHLLNFPIEQTLFLTRGMDVTITKGQLTQYFAGGKGLVQNTAELNVASPLPLSNYKFSNSLNGVLPFSSSNQSYSADGNFVESIAFDYDAIGNVRQMTPKDGVPIIYLWSYKKQHPIAEIKNASYASVEAALGGATAVDDFSNLTSPTKSQIDSFVSALETHLPEALISWFSYKPLIGIESKTDPRGMVTFYEYDTSQRLKNIKDQNGHIMKNFEYNYKQ